MDFGIDGPLVVDFIDDAYFIVEEASQTMVAQVVAMDFFVIVVASDTTFQVDLG